MLPTQLTKHTTRNALRGSWTLAPFLYCTRTIQSTRFYHSDRRGGATSSGAWDGEPASGQQDGTRSPSQSTHSRRNVDRTRRSTSVREDHIPFENLDQETESIEDQLAGSTITPAEKKIFDQLFQMKKRPQEEAAAEGAEATTPVRKKPSREPISLDSILDSVEKDVRGQRPLPRFPEALRPMAARAREAAREEKRATRQGIRAAAVARQVHAVKIAAQTELDRVDAMMRKAKTDVEVWAVFENKVLSRVRGLALDTAGTDFREQAKGKPKKKVSKESTASKVESQTIARPHQSSGASIEYSELELLASTYPRHLVRFLRHFSSSFPNSSLTRCFLPTVKSHGPTSFALGATTSFYNLHLALHSPVHNFNNLDPEAMCSILAEMDREVYDFDAETGRILGRTLQGIVKLRRGMGGQGLKVLFEGDGALRNFRGLWRWERVVEERLQEKALRQARDEALEGEDDEGMYEEEDAVIVPVQDLRKTMAEVGDSEKQIQEPRVVAAA
ncbi:hypothetical protein K431DRAFT_282067 [Polychaeton citri CBS 116435]|uniref:Mtf2-like C-terminal domain-containing protein n=1 Tax=Polychaeton citri CBS 116435 TaxID=1314669 RepID=A0A9P4QDI1_9PEZI|nr:hypothetical protein K431DRAFT_282067 [Polychaeton citri CBS 116435]